MSKRITAQFRCYCCVAMAGAIVLAMVAPDATRSHELFANAESHSQRVGFKQYGDPAQGMDRMSHSLYFARTGQVGSTKGKDSQPSLKDIKRQLDILNKRISVLTRAVNALIRKANALTRAHVGKMLKKKQIEVMALGKPKEIFNPNPGKEEPKDEKDLRTILHELPEEGGTALR